MFLLRRFMSFSLAGVLLVSVISCGGGQSSGSASESADISSVKFDLNGAVGLAIDDSPHYGALTTDGGSSNLKRVETDNSLSSAVSEGSVNVRSFMIAANNQVYLLLSSPIESCILVRVDGETNEATCVDSTLSSINWENRYGDPIQFDAEGNVYYQGASDGRTVLRRSSLVETTDLINDYISLEGFLVLSDGNVIIVGKTGPTDTDWTRLVTPDGALKSFLNFAPQFLARFPDNNVYISGAKGYTVARYLTATGEFDSLGWVGSAETSYYSTPANYTFYSHYPDHDPRNSHLLRTADGKVYIENGQLVQLYPVASQANTTVSQVTISKGILTYIVLAGFNSENQNKLVLYNTDTGAETDLLGSEDIEVYHLNYLNSNDHQIVMFDGLRFSDNRYVLCQVDLTDNNTLICSLTDTGKLTDFQLFDDADTIAGGGTNATKTYTIGGIVTGLYGTLVLQNNGNDTLTLTEDGSFTFPIAVDSNYDVSVLSQPTGQTCTVSNGSGAVSGDHVTSVSVVCVGYTISGTVTGLIGTLVLQNNGSDTLTLTQNGPFTFSATLANAAAYNVTIQANPLGQICTVSEGGGAVSDAHVTSVSVACSTNAGVIITMAGGGSSYPGDGKGATSAGLSSPSSVAFDSSGNLYLSESSRIRKIDTNGIITTVAGTGSSGFSGDGGAATSAKLSSAQGIAIDPSGNLYFADSNNHRIRKVDTNGIITTIAGNGVQGFSGDGGPATNAKLSNPSGIAIGGSGNLYIADSSNTRIRMVDTNGTTTTVVGNGNWGFSGDGVAATATTLNSPSGIAFDESGNLYIADTYNHRIRKVDTNGIITTVAGNGSQGSGGDGDPATSAQLNTPQGITIDSSGNLYIADTYNHRIRKVDTNGITTVAGNGTQDFSGDGGLSASAGLNYPRRIAFDSSGNLYIADSSNNRIRMVAGE